MGLKQSSIATDTSTTVNDPAPLEKECSNDAVEVEHVSSSGQPSPPLSRIGLNDHKAGMEGLDKEKINQVRSY